MIIDHPCLKDNLSAARLNFVRDKGPVKTIKQGNR